MPVLRHVRVVREDGELTFLDGVPVPVHFQLVRFDHQPAPFQVRIEGFDLRALSIDIRLDRLDIRPVRLRQRLDMLRLRIVERDGVLVGAVDRLRALHTNLCALEGQCRFRDPRLVVRDERTQLRRGHLDRAQFDLRCHVRDGLQKLVVLHEAFLIGRVRLPEHLHVLREGRLCLPHRLDPDLGVLVGLVREVLREQLGTFGLGPGLLGKLYHSRQHPTQAGVLVARGILLGAVRPEHVALLSLPEAVPLLQRQRHCRHVALQIQVDQPFRDGQRERIDVPRTDGVAPAHGAEEGFLANGGVGVQRVR